MRTTVGMLMLVAALAGCTWTPWSSDRGQPVPPDHEYVTSMPAQPPTGRGPKAPAVASVSTPAPPPTTNAASTTRSAAPESEMIEAALIQVNGKFISVGQLLRPIRRELEAAAAGASEAQFRARARDMIAAEARNQIEQMLLLAEAAKRLSGRETRVVESEVDRRVRQALAQVNGSQTALAEQLRREGMDLESYRQLLHRHLMVQTYLQQRLFSKIYVTRHMMWRYYEAHAQEFRSCGRVQMQIISVGLTALAPVGRQTLTQAERLAAGEKARQEIDKAAAALAEGGDFAEVARKFSRGPKASTGGVWPMMDLGSFRATQIEQAGCRQKVGQVSKPIETPDGFYIVKTLACEPPKQLAFEEVQDRIEDILTRQQYEQHTRKYLDELVGKATIVTAQKFQQLCADAAVRLFYEP